MNFPSILQTPEPHGHFVQLHNHDLLVLAKNVAQYLWEGLRRKESALIIATPEQREMILPQLRELGAEPEQAITQSRLLLLDAERTLGEFMMDGHPNEDRLERTIRTAMQKLQAVDHTGLRAYGEMVGILWKAHRYTAAIRLEEFWNKLLQKGGFTLFCSYPIDIFDKEFQISGVDALLCDHTHLIPTGADETLQRAIDQALEERLGERFHGLRLLMKADHRPSWAVLPQAEGMILWLRNNLPDEAEEILSLARQYYNASDPANECHC